MASHPVVPWNGDRIVFLAQAAREGKPVSGSLGISRFPGRPAAERSCTRSEKAGCDKGLAAAGFVGENAGSFVDSSGSVVVLPGSFVESPGSLVGACCRNRDISGRMSHQTRHNDRLWRV
jgi:hypothetical protein